MRVPSVVCGAAATAARWGSAPAARAAAVSARAPEQSSDAPGRPALACETARAYRPGGSASSATGRGFAPFGSPIRNVNSFAPVTRPVPPATGTTRRQHLWRYC